MNDLERLLDEAIAYYDLERAYLRDLQDERRMATNKSYAWKIDMDRSITIARSNLYEAEEEVIRRRAMLESKEARP